MHYNWLSSISIQGGEKVCHTFTKKTKSIFVYFNVVRNWRWIFVFTLGCKLAKKLIRHDHTSFAIWQHFIHWHINRNYFPSANNFFFLNKNPYFRLKMFVLFFQKPITHVIFVGNFNGVQVVRCLFLGSKYEDPKIEQKVLFVNFKKEILLFHHQMSYIPSSFSAAYKILISSEHGGIFSQFLMTFHQMVYHFWWQDFFFAILFQGYTLNWLWIPR